MKVNPTGDGTEDAYWSRPVDSLFAQLESRVQGLTTAEATARQAAVGSNTLDSGHQVSPWRLFINQLKSPIMLILLFATLMSAFLKDWVDAAIILLIVIGSSILSFVQEFKAGNAVAKLKEQVSARVSALRDGVIATVPIRDVVPGDVVRLSAGALIPGDGVVIEARDCFVNQATLTGETYPVEKTPNPVSPETGLAERTNCVFMGTNVRSGSATILIVHTGKATSLGHISQRLSVRPPETEFERGIRQLGHLLTEVMLILVLVIFALNIALHKPVMDSLLFSLALAVGLTPQLLPAVININLATGAKVMAEKGVIVRRLASIENFGSMDVLCTDKTGTLTEGVVQLDGALGVDGQATDRAALYAQLNAAFQTGLENPLDAAILSGTSASIDGWTKVDEIPYDFTRKRLSVVVSPPGGGQALLITKGALRNVLEVCVPLGEEADARIESLYEGWSSQGYRVLGVAARSVEAKRGYNAQDETSLDFVGFLLFLDPPKPDVIQTVTDLQSLGVSLKIITGDNRLVARHTAESIGLTITGLVTGEELDQAGTDALPQLVEKSNLFVEVDPNQKERIILAQKKLSHVVGYMGDGINDAPALHAADVGISVMSAVDVAKEAADFVLMEKSLAALHDGILLGRSTFANTLKYVFMATSANFGNMFSMAGASLLLPFLPMLPKQILLINFLTDLPEMTIARDNVDEFYIRQPRRWDIGFIRRFMLVFGPLSSLFDFATFGLLYFVLRADQQQFHTGWFIESVLSAALVVFVLRTQLPLRHSRPARPLLLATAVVGLIALALPYSPLARLLGFVPLPISTLAVILGIVAAYVLATENVKHWFYRSRFLKGKG